MPADEIHAIVEEFVSSAETAADLGFEVIQLHAAHGYFLSELLSPELNCRSDEFGDGAGTTCRIIEEIRHRRPSVFVDVRFSLFEGLRDANSERSIRREQIRRLAKSGVHMFSVSNGLYNIDRFLIYPPKKAGAGIYIPDAQSLASEFSDTIWNVAGNIWDLAQVPDRPTNLTYSIGRSLIADPEFISKSQDGDHVGLRACCRLGHCHYYSRRRNHLECGVNGEFGPAPIQ